MTIEGEREQRTSQLFPIGNKSVSRVLQESTSGAAFVPIFREEIAFLEQQEEQNDTLLFVYLTDQTNRVSTEYAPEYIPEYIRGFILTLRAIRLHAQNVGVPLPKVTMMDIDLHNADMMIEGDPNESMGEHWIKHKDIVSKQEKELGHLWEQTVGGSVYFYGGCLASYYLLKRASKL